MIKKILFVMVAIGACIWFSMYIQSYNNNTNFNVQQRFKDITQSTDEQALKILKGVDEKKEKAFEILKERKDNLIRQQQKELFDRH